MPDLTVYDWMDETRDFDPAIERVRRSLGVGLSYHTYRSDRSESGYPDRHYVGAGGDLLRELKSASGRVSAAQREWIDGLRAAGVDADVWRPRDLASGRVQAELSSIAWRRPGGVVGLPVLDWLAVDPGAGRSGRAPGHRSRGGFQLGGSPCPGCPLCSDGPAPR